MGIVDFLSFFLSFHFFVHSFFGNRIKRIDKVLLLSPFLFLSIKRIFFCEPKKITIRNWYYLWAYGKNCQRHNQFCWSNVFLIFFMEFKQCDPIEWCAHRLISQSEGQKTNSWTNCYVLHTQKLQIHRNSKPERLRVEMIEKPRGFATTKRIKTMRTKKIALVWIISENFACCHQYFSWNTMHDKCHTNKQEKKKKKSNKQWDIFAVKILDKKLGGNNSFIVVVGFHFIMSHINFRWICEYCLVSVALVCFLVCWPNAAKLVAVFVCLCVRCTGTSRL